MDFAFYQRIMTAAEGQGIAGRDMENSMVCAWTGTGFSVDVFES